MSTMLASPSIGSASPWRGKTAFERNVLPDFTRWFVDQVDQYRPDYLIPTEAKGARLLELVLAYARDELNRPIEAPMLYRIALPYVGREVLEGSRVLVLDDALRTGSNLRRHWDRITSYGARDIHSVACIADAGQEGRKLAHCYRLADAELYREYVWLLTELVVARGLPPEIDHHHFLLELPERLPVAWRRLEAELGRYGSLALDGPAVDDELVSMTLHFPTLPGTVEHPSEGEIHCEGVNKTRLFPYQPNDGALVVPICFPALRLPAETPEVLSGEHARRLVRQWSQCDCSIGELLVDEAQVYDHETILRMLSTCTEVELLCGLARVFARLYPGEKIVFTGQRELFHWLYGKDAGERIAERIDQEIEAALAEPVNEQCSEAEGETHPPLYLDDEVVSTTTNIARLLKDRYDQEAQEQGKSPEECVGWSMTEVHEALPDASSLLISRCFSFGLSTTTLVPYVEAQTLADGSIEVRRKYRVSEPNRENEQFETREDHDQQIAEELIAFIAYYLHEKSSYYGEHPLRPEVLTYLTAILHPLVLAPHNIAISLQPGNPHLQIVLQRSPAPVALLDATLTMYMVRDGGVVATSRFKRLFEKDARMQLRLGQSFELIEGFLDQLIPFLDGTPEDERASTLACWAMSTDRRLGLEHVRHDLDVVAAQLEAPLRRMLREETEKRPLGLYETARDAQAAADEKLTLLAAEPREALEKHWPAPLMMRERTLLKSLARPAEAGAIYKLPSALSEVFDTVISLVEQLEAASIRAWAKDGNAAHEQAAHAAIRGSATIKHALMSLREEHATPPSTATGRELFTAAAEDLLRTISILRAFVAATAGAYGAIDNGSHVRDGEHPETLLFLDLASSFEYARTRERVDAYEWKNAGLNLAAQWGCAFGGRQGRDREGDAIWIEFSERGDPAVLCGALIQEHARALGSVDDITLRWGFYAAIDDGYVQGGDGRNAIGLCIDRASKLAKFGSSDEIVDRVRVTPDARTLCSPVLQEEPLMKQAEEVKLDGGSDSNTHFFAFEIDSDAIVRRLCEQISATAVRIRPSTPQSRRESGGGVSKEAAARSATR